MPSNISDDSVNYRNRLYSELKQDFLNQVKYFESLGAVVKVQWECDFIERNPELVNEKREPAEALIPRHALRGGKTETYCEKAAAYVLVA